MAHTLRIATFNCENLFSRPKVFKQESARSKELLGYVAQLQEALKNSVFDHDRIKELEAQLRGLPQLTTCAASTKRPPVPPIGWAALS
jgi:hypothetical protein